MISVKAILTDRNGFIKWTEVPYPPPFTYRVPILLNPSAGLSQSVEVREFLLQNFDLETGLAEYTE